MPESGFRGVFQAHHQGVFQALQGSLKLISESSAKTSFGSRAEGGERRRLLRSREVVAVVHWLVWLHVGVARVSEGIFFIHIIKCLVRNFWITWKCILISIIYIFWMYCKKRSTLQGSPCLVLRKRRGTPAQLREPEPLACIIIIVNISFWYSELGLLSCIIIIIIIVIINFQPLLILVLKTQATLLHYHCRNQYYFYYHKQSLS